MKNKGRRDFIKNSILATAGTLYIPSFLKAFDLGTHQLGMGNGRSLVIIQWSGGNDGLNAIVPFANDLYYKNRPTLAIKKEEVIRLNDQQGLNPALQPLQALYDQGELSIINSVGYPNPVRSHFRSMDIWQSASHSNQYLSTGWLGRYMDLQGEEINPYHLLELDDNLSLALKGQVNNGFAAADFRRLKKSIRNPLHQDLVHHHDHAHEENVAYLYKTMSNTFSSADYLLQKSNQSLSSTTYPNTQIGKSLKKVAGLINANTNTKVYYVNMTGFDTHAQQKGTQTRLFSQYAEAIAAFTKDLKKGNRWNDTLVMTFSEFGRRVKQNSSGGTDHGTANNVYLMGGQLKKAGFYNNAPNLSDLDNGDLKFQIDFRRIYATILKRWLNTNDDQILGKHFDLLHFV